MKIVICGGGTAGHVYPGLALAEALKALDNQIEIVWVGTADGLEAKVVPAAGLEFLTYNVSGLPRKISPQAVKAIYQLVTVLPTARKLLNKIQPAVVVGMGGYASLPLMLAAGRKYPTIIFEQNSVPGLANRLLRRRVSAVAVTYKESCPFFSGARRLAITGNPVRSQVMQIKREQAAEKLQVNPVKPTVLIFGGSRGARKINEAAAATYPAMRHLDGLQIVHITGNMEYEMTAKLLDEQKRRDDKVEYHLFSYLDEIWLAYAASDLLVGRAGATTLAEITTRGLPAILIPYPFATDDHQLKNARIMEAAGAAKIILDEDLNSDTLWRAISDIVFNPETLERMSQNSAGAGQPDAAKRGAGLIISLQ